MSLRRIGRVTVQVDDLDQAAADFASAFAIEFERITHPTLGVPAADSEVVCIVARGAGAIPGPLADVAVVVDDVGVVEQLLAERGITVSPGADGVLAVDFHGIPVHLAEGAGNAHAEVGASRFDRAVLAVEDIHAASADLAEVVGIALQVFDVDNMRIRVALGEDGIEFIGRMDPQIDIEQLWNWPISGFAVQVEDLDATKARMAALGAVISFEFTTPGGMPEVFYGKPGLHGVPITLMPVHEAGSLLESMGVDDGATDVSPTIN